MLAQTTSSSPDLTSPGFWSTPTPWIVIAVVAIALVAFAIMVRRQRSAGLAHRFGPEYERTVSRAGSRERAEAELAEREHRVRKYDLRPLAPGARERYVEEWRSVQARFVDQPGTAIDDADGLVQSVMRDRGYPVQGFEQRAADLSVEHSDDVAKYRTANLIALKNRRGEASTEELRQALTQYRALFESLVGVDTVDAANRRQGA